MKEAFEAAPGFWIGWAVLSVMAVIGLIIQNELLAYGSAFSAAILGWIGYGIWMNKD